jgi:hypothetical protein
MMENMATNLARLNKEFYHQTVTTEQIEEYLTAESGIDLQPVFFC